MEAHSISDHSSTRLEPNTRTVRPSDRGTISISLVQLPDNYSDGSSFVETSGERSHFVPQLHPPTVVAAHNFAVTQRIADKATSQSPHQVACECTQCSADDCTHRGAHFDSVIRTDQ